MAEKSVGKLRQIWPAIEVGVGLATFSLLSTFCGTTTSGVRVSDASGSMVAKTGHGDEPYDPEIHGQLADWLQPGESPADIPYVKHVHKDGWPVGGTLVNFVLDIMGSIHI